jgi:hypothetical protein
MRRDILIVVFALLTATTGPLALHFYNKASSLESDVAAMQRRLATCTSAAISQ